jgi:hypothetical protein
LSQRSGADLRVGIVGYRDYPLYFDATRHATKLKQLAASGESPTTPINGHITDGRAFDPYRNTGNAITIVQPNDNNNLTSTNPNSDSSSSGGLMQLVDRVRAIATSDKQPLLKASEGFTVVADWLDKKMDEQVGSVGCRHSFTMVTVVYFSDNVYLLFL